MRRAPPTEWTTKNPILAQGEFGVEIPPGSSGPYQFKLGDGVTPWNSLPYGGLQGPPGTSASQTLNALAPLHYDPVTQTISLEDPQDSGTIVGGFF